MLRYCTLARAQSRRHFTDETFTYQPPLIVTPYFLRTPAQLLIKLPHTVRGVGIELVKCFQPKLDGAQQERLAQIVGYIAVVRGSTINRLSFVPL